MITSVSGVEDAIVWVIVADLHVLVELFLSVQSLVHALAVKGFHMVSANGAWAFGVPVFGAAGCSDF